MAPMNTCLYCNRNFKACRNTLGKYCSNSCQREFEYNSNVKNWLEGKNKGWMSQTRQLSPYIKRYLREIRGTDCERCGWDERHPVDGAILTEFDHTDGNAENCRPENLKILCPNCHAMTPTYRARNKNSTRNR